MLKKIALALAIAIATIGSAFAQVDVNKADQAALDGVKGVGPKTSKAILEARKSGGPFKDWADFETRVKGVGGKSAVKLAAAGLTVNGESRPAASAASAIAPAEEKKKKASGVKLAASSPASASAHVKK